MASASAVPFAEATRRILELRPKVAAFDCDGTLWSIDAGLGFLDWELERQLVDAVTAATARTRLRAYQAGDIDEDTFNGYLASLHAGLPVATVEAAAREYVATHIPPALFQQMAELLGQLARSGCQIWLVSSSNQWIIEAAAPLIGVPPQQVLASAAVSVRRTRHRSAAARTERRRQAPGAASRPRAGTGCRLRQLALGRGNARLRGRSVRGASDAGTYRYCGHQSLARAVANLGQARARQRPPTAVADAQGCPATGARIYP